MMDVLQPLNGQLAYHHENGERSMVKVEIAGMGVRRVRVANLPPEIPERILRDVLSRYGDVKRITDEQWSRVYRYPVSNGGRLVEVGLQKHIPSQMIIVGHRILISYEGQPITCYGCNEPGHQQQDCPNRKKTEYQTTGSNARNWANVTQGSERDGADEERPNEEGSNPTAVDEKGEGRTPIEHGREYRKQEETLDESVTERSLTAEENLYDDDVNNSAASIGMDMNSLQDSTEEIGGKNMETDLATPLSPTPLTDRDKPTNAVDGARTRQESGEHDAEEGTRQVTQSLSPKRN
jgi:hypothetical protein